MKIRALPTLLYIGILSLASSPAFSADIFSDSFESGDMSATNSSAFKWAGNNRTSVVMQDINDGPVAVYNNKPIYNIADSTMPDGTPKNWTAKSGKYSLRFRYQAGKPWSEQRFNLGVPHRDIWIRYWLRVPGNFSHGTSRPTNHKFFALWMDGYSSKGDGPTVIWEFWNDGKNGSDLAIHYSEGGFTGAGGHKQLTPFITYPSDQGRWMQIVLHVKAATNSSSGDGVIHMWRRWERQSNFTKIHEITNANIAAPSAGPDGWKAGYIMGWANAAYANDTEWLMDDFVVSDSSPIAGLLGQLPKPPSNLSVQ